MEIGATKAVQDRLKTTKIAESKGVSLVFCWDTHLTKIKGRNVLFIVNASNRYTIAMTNIEPRNWNYYAMYISRVIYGVMQEMGYSEDQIGQYFKMSGDTTVTKTHGRKSVGDINRMVMDAQYFGKKLEKEAKYQWELSEYLNRDICQPEGFDAYGYPNEFFKLDMERLGIIPKRKPAKIIDFTAPHKRKTESEIRISEVEKMALDKKMSYGQYVAMLEEEKKKGYDTRK